MNKLSLRSVVGMLLASAKVSLASGLSGLFAPPSVSYEEAGGARNGYLFNFGTHGYLSEPLSLASSRNLNVVTIGRKPKSRIHLQIYKPSPEGSKYGLRIVPEVDVKNIHKLGAGKMQAIGVNRFTRLLEKKKLRDTSNMDLFEIRMDPVSTEYFKLVYDGLCATPALTLGIIFIKCENSENIPALHLAQLFKVTSGTKTHPIHIPKGISSYYFEGEAPCTRYIPDGSRANFFLINKNYQSDSCIEKEPRANPKYRTPGVA